jgi:hypothetical protein
MQFKLNYNFIYLKKIKDVSSSHPKFMMHLKLKEIILHRIDLPVGNYIMMSNFDVNFHKTLDGNTSSLIYLVFR